MVGDNLEEDISTPKKLGMITLLIDRKNHYRKKPPNVDYLIKSLFELQGKIKVEKRIKIQKIKIWQ